MHTVQTHPGNASTFLTHLFGQGLDDDRYVVERFQSMADGDIRPLRAKGPRTKGRPKAPGTIASRQVVRKMRPARDEIIVATGINLRNSGVQYWANLLCGGTCCIDEWRSPGDVLPARRRPDVHCPNSNLMEDIPVPYRNPDKAREHGRERYRRLTEERLASGMCPKCGREPLPPDRSLCRSCGEKRRKAERDRYAKGKTEGRLYGGRDPKVRRRIGRERSRRRLRRIPGRRPVHALRPPFPGPGRRDLPGLP